MNLSWSAFITNVWNPANLKRYISGDAGENVSITSVPLDHLTAFQVLLSNDVWWLQRDVISDIPQLIGPQETLDIR